jgi:SAM-dependent methyltransferase
MQSSGKYMESTNILKSVADYYSEKIVTHGSTPQGVDWNGEAGQVNRFKQLLKVVNHDEPFSIADLGCGYGALLKHLNEVQCQEFSYTGLDVSAEMIQAAQSAYNGQKNVRFMQSATPKEKSDYMVASGIFNVRLEHSDAEWQHYIETTLHQMNSFTEKGFSFNCLTSYSDADKKRNYLYYASPCHLFDFCKKNISNQVALLHDYGLYEFTIIVRK